MKTNKRTSKAIKQSGVKLGCTVNFAGVAPEDDANNGDYENEFRVVENLVLSQYVARSISIQDFVALTRSMDIPYASVKKNYAAFIKEQLNDGRIVEIPTVMDDKTYVVV